MPRYLARFSIDEAILALRKHKGNITHAARELGCSLRTLQRWTKGKPEIEKTLVNLREIHGLPVSGKLQRIEHSENRHESRHKVPEQIPREELDGVIAAYMEAKQAVDEIYHVLQLAQLRCRNAASLREAGLCRGDTKGVDDCFSSRLNSADARVMAEKLAAKMNERVRGFLEDEDEAE